LLADWKDDRERRPFLAPPAWGSGGPRLSIDLSIDLINVMMIMSGAPRFRERLQVYYMSIICLLYDQTWMI
jgi:hypothetical protein